MLIKFFYIFYIYLFIRALSSVQNKDSKIAKMTVLCGIFTEKTVDKFQKFVKRYLNSCETTKFKDILHTKTCTYYIYNVFVGVIELPLPLK